MIHPSGSQATAKAVAGAELVTIEGMRHSVPRELVPRLVDLIAKHTHKDVCARLADASGPT
jgi:hypothetical protein